MAAILPVAVLMLAQAATGDASYGPAAPVAPKAPAPVQSAQRQCAPEITDPNSREIMVCAPKPEGYRIDPDVLKARKQRREALAGRPHNPHESFKDNGCQVVGPAGCIFKPGVNLLAAAATVAEIADRLSKGQEIGSIFVTEPQTSEYQLYLEAKKEREAKEAADAAKKAKAAAKATSAPSPTAPAAPSSAPR
jgi:hypothetical protein